MYHERYDTNRDPPAIPVGPDYLPLDSKDAVHSYNRFSTPASGEVAKITAMADCHANYIQYVASEDCFVISDRYINAFVKFKRDGTLLWQFGGSNPKGKSFSVSETWQVNHGFEYEEDGRIVFFNNGANMMGGTSKIMEFKLDESTMSSTKLWEKNTNGASGTFGNIQRLPDGHYLVCASNAGKIEELDGSKNVVRGFSSKEFGYAEFRESLYGPPVDY